MNAEDRVVKFYFKDLQPGVNGRDGKDGVSSAFTIEDIENGHRLTITDVDGINTIDVLNGTNGKDGVNPIVSIEQTADGHRLTFTDAEGDKTFDVVNGLSPIPTKNAVTNFLMNQSSDNLMELVDGLDPATLPIVRLNGNRIVESNCNSSTDSNATMFLLSKNPRHLPNGLNDLTDDDYITFNYDRESNLYCVLSGLVQTPGTPDIQIVNMAPYFTIYAKVSGSTEIYNTVCTLPCGAGGNGIAQFGNAVYSVDDGNPRNEYVTLSIAVVGTIYPYYQNCDVSLDFYFGLMDMNSEPTNLIGTFNNSLYATKVIRKTI